GAPLHHGRPAPGEIFPQDLREDPQEARRAVLDRLADRGLVHEGRPEGGVATHDAKKQPSPPVPAKAGTRGDTLFATRIACFPLAPGRTGFVVGRGKERSLSRAPRVMTTEPAEP